MSSSEANTVWNDITSNLPELTANFPEGDNGPFTTFSMSVVGSIKDSEGNVTEQSRHAVEAYAHQTLPNGTRVICVYDPNYANNDNCAQSISIPTIGAPTYNGLNSWGSGWTLGTFDIYPTALARQGQFITRNISYCREINRDRFAQNDCGS
jgi:hypothetical protein